MVAKTFITRRELDAQVVEGLRARYEDAGFTFDASPKPADLPDFFGDYIPDALARKLGVNVAIEVKGRRAGSAERQLQTLRRLFEGRPDWRFHVVYSPSDEAQHSPPLPVVGAAAIRSRAAEARILAAQGHRPWALVMAWSLMEASLRLRNGEPEGRAHSSLSVLQTLAENGFVEQESFRQLCELADLRNRIAHGDLTAEPAEADVELVLSVVESALNADVEPAG